MEEGEGDRERDGREEKEREEGIKGKKGNMKMGRRVEGKKEKE